MAKGLTKTYGSLTFSWDGKAETVKIEGVRSTTNETLAEKFDEFFHRCFPRRTDCEKNSRRVHLKIQGANHGNDGGQGFTRVPKPQV